MVIPRLVGQALAGEPLTVYGDGSQRRCFCHVADVVRALSGLIGEERSYGGVFNVGSSEETSILQLARLVLQLTGAGSEISLIPYEEAYGEGFEDMYRRVPDTSKVRELIGWQPTRGLEEIVRDVVAERRSLPGEPTPQAAELAAG
jgi:UDP-glucose 4-epimerase